MAYIKDKVSIIIPIYNTGIYLKRCLDSLLAQTYQDLDIIIIDDGSNDKVTLDIIAGYAKKDTRIRVFHKENGGLSKAYNDGLDKVIGEYTVFVDSDDYLKKDAISLLVSKCVGVDMVEASYTLKFEHLVFYRTNAKKEMVLEKPATLYGLCNNTVVNNYAWAKIYRSELLEDIRFPTSYNNFSDLEFSAYVFLKASKVRVIKDRIYYYYQRKGSSTNGMSYQEAKKMFYAFKLQEDILNSHYDGNFTNYTNYYRSEMMILFGYMKNKEKLAKDDIWLPQYDDTKILKILKFFRWLAWKVVCIKYGLGNRGYVRK